MFSAAAASFYYFVLWALSIMGRAIPRVSSLSWWPDMDTGADTDVYETKEEEARTRTNLDVEFVRPDVCGREFLK